MRAAWVLGVVLVPGVAAADERPGRIVLYDAFGTPTECTVSGRVLENKGIEPGRTDRGTLGNLVDNTRTLETDEIAGAVVELEVRGRRARATTDDDGAFEVSLRFDPPITSATAAIDARMIDNRGHATPPARGMLHVIPPGRAVAVISDFDDTIAKTYVRSKRRMLEATVLSSSAEVELVEGVGAAYARAAAAGARAFFYVSGSPNSFHDRIRDVLDRHKLPRGPVILKNFGSDALTEQEAYKGERIRRIMDTFPDLSFILIGDSGERDPEIYEAVARERPGRVAAIVIRRAPESVLEKRRFRGMTLIDDYRRDSDLLVRLVRKASRLGPTRSGR